MDHSLSLTAIHRLVWIALLAALTAAGAVIAVPLGPLSPVPITLQTMFVLLSGLILGSRGGAAAVLLYLAAGGLGLPVFAGGRGGLAMLLGPTGGFMLGFLLAAMLCGLAKRHGRPSFPRDALLCAAGAAVILLAGSLRLMSVLDVSFGKALLAGAVPFLPGEAIKCCAAAGIHRFLASRRLLP
jgi:biotin transport system substrate-specific component